MTAYAIRRCFQGLAVVFVVTIVVFGLLHALPGGPARAILGPKANSAALASFSRANNLDKPLPVQYVLWIGKVVRGDLGYSYTQNQSVISLIGERLPKTLILTTLSVLVALLIGVPLGMFQAARRGGAIDRSMTVLSLAAYSIPIFLVGLLGVWLFSVKWGLLPPQAPQGTTVGQILAQPSALVLPVLSLGVGSAAVFSRYMRSSTVENLVQDYVRFAQAKGAKQSRIMFRHVARNALGPIATQLGLFLPVLLAGTVIVESVFNYPGMGLLFWNAATQRDYPVELGVVLIVALATVVGSLLADVGYALLDPRIRYDRG
jgi:peptide/nickel transport system permease protein